MGRHKHLSSTQDQTNAINAFAERKLEQLQAGDLCRTLTPTQRAGITADRNNSKMISFSDNDYLGLSSHPDVIAGGVAAAKLYGAGAGASRLITGDNPLNHEVEQKLAALKGAQSALVFGSGYLANTGTIPVLAGKGDLIVLDELSHACIHAGARLSGATVCQFCHNDTDHLHALLTEHSHCKRKLVITETVFSMDGDRAPLHTLNDICEQTSAWLMTDDAHGLGLPGIENQAPIQMGTLSKATGTYGGYVCGPDALIELLINRARSFVYTTGLPPFVLGATNVALEIIAGDNSLGRKAMENTQLFCKLMDLPEPESTIVPLVVGEARDALDLSAKLAEAGFLVTAIRPPTVPQGTARLRFAFSAQHQASDIQRLANAVISAIAPKAVAV